MGCPSFVIIGDNLTFSVATHDPDTGVLTDADAVPGYEVYEEDGDTAILSGSMTKRKAANDGRYVAKIACTAANGFENGKTYTIEIVATVDGDQGGITYTFTSISGIVSNLKYVNDVALTGDGSATPWGPAY